MDSAGERWLIVVVDDVVKGQTCFVVLYPIKSTVREKSEIWTENSHWWNTITRSLIGYIKGNNQTEVASRSRKRFVIGMEIFSLNQLHVSQEFALICFELPKSSPHSKLFAFLWTQRTNCIIKGLCYAANERHPTNRRLKCVPQITRSAWTRG